MNNSEPEPPKRNWYYIISPCVIAGILAFVWTLYWFIIFEMESGWSILGVISGLPFLVVMILADVIVKVTVKKKTVKIWLIELSIIAACIMLFVLYVYTL